MDSSVSPRLDVDEEGKDTASSTTPYSTPTTTPTPESQVQYIDR